MIFVVIAIIIAWKVVKRTRFLKPEEVDLHTDLQEIEDYTRDFEEKEDLKPASNGFVRILGKLW
jgi:amino acid transporter